MLGKASAPHHISQYIVVDHRHACDFVLGRSMSTQAAWTWPTWVLCSMTDSLDMSGFGGDFGQDRTVVILAQAI